MDTPTTSDEVRECLRQAGDCVQQAASQTDPKLRQDFLIIGACWLKLSYELLQRLANFSKSKAPSRQKGDCDRQKRPETSILSAQFQNGLIAR